MTRTELTADIMLNRGWKPVGIGIFFYDDKVAKLDAIVANIQKKNSDGTYFWRLRCTLDNENIYSKTDYGMCSTYKIFYKSEYLEASTDGVNWNQIAERDVEIGKRCIYAD